MTNFSTLLAYYSIHADEVLDYNTRLPRRWHQFRISEHSEPYFLDRQENITEWQRKVARTTLSTAPVEILVLLLET